MLVAPKGFSNSKGAKDGQYCKDEHEIEAVFVILFHINTYIIYGCSVPGSVCEVTKERLHKGSTNEATGVDNTDRHP